MSEEGEKTQLKEFKITTLTPGWIHYENMLFLQREEIIKNLIKSNAEPTSNPESRAALVGELRGIEKARNIAPKLIDRFNELNEKDLEKEKQ